MRKQIFRILILVLGCLLSFLIFMKIKSKQPNNGFVRKKSTVIVSKSSALKLPARVFYFVGEPNDEISLYSTYDPLAIFKTDSSLQKLLTIHLNGGQNFDKINGYTILRFTPSSKICLSNTEGHLKIFSSEKSNSYKIPMRYSDNCTPISNSTIIARTIELKDNEKSISLIKVRLSGDSKEIKRYKLPRHADGFFGNDGILRFDKQSSRLIYSYVYLGEFLCLDTNLNLIYKGKTIDTVTTPKLKLSIFRTKLKTGLTGNTITQATPPKAINMDFTIHNGLIYMISKLKSDNETQTAFNKNQPIDVYILKSGRYVHSFYIPKFESLEIKKIEINKQSIFALSDSYLIRYDIKNAKKR